MVDFHSFVANIHAFPSNGSDGMTLRDYFAAAVLPALLAVPAPVNTTASEDRRNAAVAAYAMADAMLAAREGK